MLPPSYCCFIVGSKGSHRCSADKGFAVVLLPVAGEVCGMLRLILREKPFAFACNLLKPRSSSIFTKDYFHRTILGVKLIERVFS